MRSLLMLHAVVGRNAVNRLMLKKQKRFLRTAAAEEGPNNSIRPRPLSRLKLERFYGAHGDGDDDTERHSSESMTTKQLVVESNNFPLDEYKIEVDSAVVCCRRLLLGFFALI